MTFLAGAVISFLNSQTGAERARLLRILSAYVDGIISRRSALDQVAAIVENDPFLGTEDILNHALSIGRAGAWSYFHPLLQHQPRNLPLAKRHVVLLWRSWLFYCCTRRDVENVDPQPDEDQDAQPGRPAVLVMVNDRTSEDNISSLPPVDPAPVDLDDSVSLSTDTADRTNSRMSRPSDEGS